MRKLNRGRADAAGTAMHEEKLALLQGRHLKDVCPHRKEGFGNATSLYHGVAAWERQAVRGGYAAVFGVAATGDEGAHGIADIEGCIVCRGRHDAGDFEAQNRRGTVRRGILALALQYVGPVDSRRFNLNDDFMRAWCRSGHRAKLEYFRPARTEEVDEAHRFRCLPPHGKGLREVHSARRSRSRCNRPSGSGGGFSCHMH